MSDSPFVLDVGDADFAEKVIEQSRQRPVVVDFWAPWCGPCRMLGPILEKLTQEKAGEVLLAKVDVDENPVLAQQFQVQSIPMVLAFRDGEVVLGFRGLLPESEVRMFYDRIVPSPLDLQVREAGQREASEPAEAEKIYRQVLAQDRDHVGALVGLARLLISVGQDQEAGELLERAYGGEQAAEIEKLKNLLALRADARGLPDEATLNARVQAEPENAELRYQLGLAQAAAGRYDDALASLLAAAQRDRDLARVKVRDAMVRIFHVIGPRSEQADSYRDQLTRLLY